MQTSKLCPYDTCTLNCYIFTVAKQCFYLWPMSALHFIKFDASFLLSLKIIDIKFPVNNTGIPSSYVKYVLFLACIWCSWNFYATMLCCVLVSEIYQVQNIIKRLNVFLETDCHKISNWHGVTTIIISYDTSCFFVFLWVNWKYRKLRTH